MGQLDFRRRISQNRGGERNPADQFPALVEQGRQEFERVERDGFKTVKSIHPFFFCLLLVYPGFAKDEAKLPRQSVESLVEELQSGAEKLIGEEKLGAIETSSQRETYSQLRAAVAEPMLRRELRTM